MNVSKYKSAIIIFGVYCIFWIVCSIVLDSLVGFGMNFSTFIPFSDMGIEISLISMLIWPLSATLSLLLGGYLFAPLFLLIHKLIFRSNVDYGIFIKQKTDKFHFVVQGLFSALMAINFSLILLDINPNIVRLSIGTAEELRADHYVTTFVVLLVVTIGISNLLFSPTWFLMDSGILYSNKRRMMESYKPPEIRSVGRWYDQFLKGYASVSVFLSYFEFISIFLIEIAGDINLFLLLLIMFIPFPLFLIIPIIPALLISESIIEHRNNYIRKIAKILKITSKVDVIFEFIE
jgi:hypothetical protein